MGSIIAGAAASGCAYICCGACNSCSEAKTGAISRMPYIFLFFISAIFAILMSLYGEEEFGFKFYHTHICHSDECSGNGSVFRVSLCLFIFELFHVLIITKATAFHYLWFPLKFLCFVIALICSFVIDGLNPIFDSWGEVARVFSGLYLLIQLLIFISYAYDLNEYLRTRGDQLYEFNEEHEYSHRCCCECIPGNCYHWALGILSVFCFIATFVCLGLFYPLYDQNNSNPHCGIHESVTSVTIILAGLTATFSVFRGDGSFGVASMICFYSTFLLFTAMQADPDDASGDESCNLFHSASDGLSLWIGFFITLMSLFYAAMRSNMMVILGKEPTFVVRDNGDEVEDTDERVQSLLTKENNQEAIVMDTDTSNYDDVDDDKKAVFDDEEEGVSPEALDKKSNIYFHVVLMLAAAYMSMLFTNWGTNEDSIATTGTISFIVGVVSCWTAFLLFWWTLLAPKICPQRYPGNMQDE